MTNREWIAKGNTGCTFATLFAKSPEAVGWRFIDWTAFPGAVSEDTLIVAIEFKPWVTRIWNKEEVENWALHKGFYKEQTSNESYGLRYDCPQGKAWVQYFGPDSHVVTRQSPYPMLMFTRKLGVSYYSKVGWKGVLHLAHAFYDKISERVYDLLWNRSYEQTKKKIGHAPTVIEAAKTTFLKKDLEN